MSSRRISLLVCLACLAVGAAVSVWLGQDTGWDLRNYHLANAYAVFHGRLDIDLDPAGLQSYLNPTLDLVYEGLGTGLLSHNPRVLAAIMGLPYGVVIFAALVILHEVLPEPPGWPRRVAVAAAAVAAATGAATLCQVGTTFNEVPIAAFTLVAVAVVLPAVKRDRSLLTRSAIAGALLGFGTGLKMTALVFAPAFAAALLLTGPGAMLGLRRIGPVMLFCAAWVVGFAGSAGWWAWLMWQKFANPFFPLFNAIFRSPWYPPVNFADTRMLPHSTIQWLFYPFWWATWSARPINGELAYCDPRLAAALVSAAGLTLLATRRRVSRPLGFVLMVWAVGYVAWLSTSSIMRYGVVLEVLGVVLVACLLATVLRRPVLAASATALAAIACIAGTVVPDFGRIAYGRAVFDIDMGWTPPHALLVTVTGPTAYLADFVPKHADTRTVGFGWFNRLAEGWRLNQVTSAMIRDQVGPIYALLPAGDNSMLPLMPLIGLSPEVGPCRPIHSNLDGSSTQACLAQRLP